MKPLVEITLIELYLDRPSCWHRNFAIRFDYADHGQKLIFTTYPDWWEVYIKLRIHNFYFN